MSHDFKDPRPTGIDLLPDDLDQNPAPVNLTGQQVIDKETTLANRILGTFLATIPSNYVSQTVGPQYTLQFQVIAEQLAKLQLSVLELGQDTDFDFTRPEFIYQFLASLIFPDGDLNGLPNIQGDQSYRDFLKTMVRLLLEGATPEANREAVEALSLAEVTLFEKYKSKDAKPQDQFTFEVDVSKNIKTDSASTVTVPSHTHVVHVDASGKGSTTSVVPVDPSDTVEDHTHEIEDFILGSALSHTHALIPQFADDPFILEHNVYLALKALKPAHTLYEYRNLFREIITTLFTDSFDLSLSSYYYDDLRGYCHGAKVLTGTAGETLVDRTLFTDTTRSFRNVRVGSILTIPRLPLPSPTNVGEYRIKEVLSIIFDDAVARNYTTSPTGLSGKATVSGGIITDATQDFALTVEGETLTFSEGSNAGTYRLERVLGNNGGPVGFATGPGTQVSPAPSTLRLERRMLQAATGQTYEISLERLGVQTPRQVVLEDVSNQFFSPPAAPNIDKFFVEKGPLVKGWGDATPATAQDVSVFFDGAPLTVSSVNPYTGEITLAVAVVPFLPGLHTVTVTYWWFFNPTLGFEGLNTLGLNLNTWSLPRGRTATSPTPPSSLGGSSTSVFPMRITLGTYPTRQFPVWVGSRFIGFEQDYTASLNSPTTLLLNSPTQVSVPYAEAEKESETVLFEGKTVPPAPWVAVGNLTGSSDDEVYTLTNSDALTVGFFAQNVDLSLDSSVTSVARFQITSSTADGVFTGVGFGFHDNRRLYFAGALEINGLKHVGLLARPGQLNDANSWIIGPSSSGTILTTTTVRFTTSEMPSLFAEGDRFQVLTGGQIGVYTATSVVRQTDGVTVVTVSTPFPANFNLFGNNPITAIFETLWEDLSTWRLIADTATETATLQFGGSTQGSVVRAATGTILVSPSSLAPDITPSKAGQILWGSIGRKQTNVSAWDFMRFTGIPSGVSFTRGTAVDETMTVDPLEDSPEGWFLTSPFGSVTLSAGQLTITNGVGTSSIEATSGYERTDAFLHGKRVISTQGTFQLTQPSLGAGDAQLRVRDSVKDIVLGSILFETDVAGNHQILSFGQASLGGYSDLASQGWAGSTFDEFFYGSYLGLNKELTETWSINTSLSPTPTTGSRVIDFEVAIDAFTANAGNSIGFQVGIFYNTDRFLSIEFKFVAGVAELHFNDAAVTTVAFPWNDGAYHQYKIVAAAGGITQLYVDGTLLTFFLGVFPLVAATADVFLTALNIGGDCAFAGRLSFLSVLEFSPLGGLPIGSIPTLGIWKGGDKTDIDNWAIPRTDGSTVPNSDPAAAMVPMDWFAAALQVRLFVDPEYGAGLERPDLAPPAGYVAGDFATQSMNPSACWAVVEYAELPSYTEEFGSIAFGALESQSISEQIWTQPFEYRFFTNPTQDFVAPQRMLLNTYNVITSGDFGDDISPEVYTVTSFTNNLVLLAPIHIFADRIFFVSVDDVNLIESDWVFDKESQTISLVNPLPSQNYPVKVTFAPSKPITTTYLQNQPTFDSAILLNEGTPVVERGQQSGSNDFVVSGTQTPVTQGTITVTPAFTIQNGDRVIIDASVVPFIDSYVFLVAGTDFAIGANENITASNIETAIDASPLSTYITTTTTLNVVTLTTTSLLSNAKEDEKILLGVVENTPGSLIINGSGVGPSAMTPIPFSSVLGTPPYVLDDPYRSVRVIDTETSLYEGMAFFEVEDSGDPGLISIGCDLLTELELSATLFTEIFGVAPPIPSDPSFAPLMLGGGAFLDESTLGPPPGNAILTPNDPSPEDGNTTRFLFEDGEATYTLTDPTTGATESGPLV